MGFKRIGEIAEAVDTDYQFSSFRKVPSNITTLGTWCDLSMSSGNPVPNFYASSPLVAATLDGNKGVYHGQNVSPLTKHLKSLTMLTTSATGVPTTFTLCDYLIYYPFIDGDNTDQQDFDNTVTLPRYTNGIGVQMFVVALSSYVGGVGFTINYTNTDDVDKTTDPIIMNTAANTSSFVHGTTNVANSFGAFIPLKDNDIGIKKVNNITMLSSGGGLYAVVLVKPLANTTLREITAPREKDFMLDSPSMPTIQDGAYLNFIALPSASLISVPIIGTMQTIWK